MLTALHSFLHDTVVVIGWLSAVVVLMGYALTVSGRWAGHSARYLTLNAVGSLGLAVSTVTAHAWQAATVNVLWLVFGLGPLCRALAARSRRGHTRRGHIRRSHTRARKRTAVSASAG